MDRKIHMDRPDENLENLVNKLLGVVRNIAEHAKRTHLITRHTTAMGITKDGSPLDNEDYKKEESPETTDWNP